MRLTVSAAAVAAAAFFAATALAKPAAVPFQVNVTVTDKACTLDHPSVSKNLLILFHVVSSGKYSHQFKIWGVSSGIIKTGREGQFEVKFRAPGKYPYACYNSHALLKRGVFTLRR
jgi:plastocyanin